jgi:DNA-binding LytR/AlgR family response regulator
VAIWILLSTWGLGRRSGAWLFGLGFPAVAIHALAAVALEAHFSVSRTAGYEALFLARLPIDLLVYMAIAAALWAAMAHRHSIALHRALAAARLASQRSEGTGRTADPSDLVLVSVGSSQAPVRVSSIEWVGAAANYVVINWEGREGLVRDTLKSFEETLDPHIFVRAHRSTIVNLAKVASASSLADGSWRLTMESGAELVASRTYRDRILGRLGRR